MMLGEPCETEGQTLPRPSDGDTLTTPASVRLGLYCLGSAWTSIATSQSQCGYDMPVAVTVEGVPLTCVDDLLLAEGETVSRLGARRYLVGEGTGQVLPGSYVAFNVSNCGWERLDEAGNILGSNFISDAARAEFTIRESDYAINIEGCGGWTLTP